MLRSLLVVSPERCGYRAMYWTVRLLRDQLRKNLGQDYSDDTIRRSQHRLGYVWKRPRYVLAPDPEQEKESRIRRVLSGLPEHSVILVEDETDLLLFPPLRAMWSPRGEPARVMLSGWNARRVVSGCMNLRTDHRMAMLLDADSSHTAAASHALARQLKSVEPGDIADLGRQVRVILVETNRVTIILRTCLTALVLILSAHMSTRT